LKPESFGVTISGMDKEIAEIRRPEREGAIFLIYNKGKILLEKRTNPGKSYFGYTIIPAGKVDKTSGETASMAIDREVLEECDVVVKKKVFLDKFLHTTISNMLYETEAYLVTEYDGVIRNVEGKSEHVWVDIGRAEEYLPFADSKYIVTLARKLLSQNS